MGWFAVTKGHCQGKREQPLFASPPKGRSVSIALAPAALSVADKINLVVAPGTLLEAGIVGCRPTCCKLDSES